MDCRLFYFLYFLHTPTIVHRRKGAVILHALYEMAHNLRPGINSSLLPIISEAHKRKSHLMAGLRTHSHLSVLIISDVPKYIEILRTFGWSARGTDSGIYINDHQNKPNCQGYGIIMMIHSNFQTIYVHSSMNECTFYDIT